MHIATYSVQKAYVVRDSMAFVMKFVSASKVPSILQTLPWHLLFIGGKTKEKSVNVWKDENLAQ